MSIWGPGPFENDDGADWFADLRDEPSIDMIREALDEVSDATHLGYVEVTDGAEAVAAAEVLAELLGSPGDDPVLDYDYDEFPRSLENEFQRKSNQHITQLLKQAIDALEIILNDAENSELRQIWEEEVDEMPAWIAAITALQQRLRDVGAL